MTAAPRPGWYPDPAGATDPSVTRYRWWDGADWGSATSVSADAPTPARPPSRLRTVLVLAVGLTVFVGAALGGAVLLWREPASSSAVRTPAPAPGAPGGTVGGSTGRLDYSTRMATIGRASLRLPDDPYGLVPDPMQINGLFDTVFAANAPVHSDYANGRDWSASVMLVQVSAALGGRDLEATGQAALQGLSGAIFDLHPTAVSQVQTSDHSVDGCRGVLVTGRVSYVIPGLASRSDAVTLVLVELEDGTLIAAVSSLPDDAPTALVSLAAASLATLSVG